MRIGHGYDVHALAELGAGRSEGVGDSSCPAGSHGSQQVRPLRLGGVAIPFARGCVAHSDGDVAVHALCDALLGAAALGDIGRHFPDTDDEFRGIDSLELLRRTSRLVGEKGLRVGNVDITIAAQAPRLAPYIPAMRSALSEVLEVGLDAVSVKATTTERLGFVGREEGIAAWAVALLLPQKLT